MNVSCGASAQILWTAHLGKNQKNILFTPCCLKRRAHALRGPRCHGYVRRMHIDIVFWWKDGIRRPLGPFYCSCRHHLLYLFSLRAIRPLVYGAFGVYIDPVVASRIVALPSSLQYGLRHRPASMYLTLYCLTGPPALSGFPCRRRKPGTYAGVQVYVDAAVGLPHRRASQL